jgi:DNA repair photolyase
MDRAMAGGEGVRVAEVEAKSLLNRSGITDWTVNCYAGCRHGCRYCYARFATRFTHPSEPWGSFVDVKANAPGLLAREVKRRTIGTVFVSSVCDAWQPLEARYGLTRRCLEILLQHGFPVHTLTKSALAGRDLDILAVHHGLVDFGVTITTLDDSLARLMEPMAASPDRRLALLAEARAKGIRSYAFLGPLLPGLTDTEEQITRLLQAAREVGVDYLYLDRLNPRYGIWPDLKELLLRHYPHLAAQYGRVLFEPRSREEYTGRLRTTLQRLVARHGLEDRARFCF